MKQIVIYGKGGAGKTTIAANISAALAEWGNRVLLVGCSPTADSSHLLLGEKMARTVSSQPATAVKTDSSESVALGFRGVGCIEAGELSPGSSCSSKNLAVSLQAFKEMQIIEQFAPDLVIYDMPGYNGCIDELLLDELAADLSLLVTSADFQSMYAANRFIAALSRPGKPVTPLALVANGSVSSFEDSFVSDFAGLVKVRLAAAIPRSFAVRHSELYGKTVIEAGPLSTHAYAYRELARLLKDGLFTKDGTGGGIPLELSKLKEWAHDWGKRLGELEFGIMSDGSGI
jgi:nitrogenase iron protein NifH